MTRTTRGTLAGMLTLGSLVLAATPGIVLGAGVSPADTGLAVGVEGAPAVSVTVNRDGRRLVIEGRSRLHAMPAAAWAVLTDYDGIEQFVSSMRESRITGRGTDYVLVEQAAVGRMFFFSRRMTTILRVREKPPGLILFEDVLGRDFDSYRGEWQIEDYGNEVEIIYRLTARPSFPIPDMIARGAFRRAVHRLISEVGVEIERRAEIVGVRGLKDG